MEPHLEELIELVMWLTTCGRSELKVFDSVTYPQLEGFKFHLEASGGSSLCLQVTGESVLCPSRLSMFLVSFAPVYHATWSDASASVTFRDITRPMNFNSPLN